MKKPWLAALLNLIPLGFGYLYLRRFRRFGATLLVGTMAGFVLFLGVPLTIYACYYECSEAVVLFILIMLLSLPGAVAAFTAWNAWRLASRDGASP